MQLRYRSVLPLVAVCLALSIAPALAAKPEPTPLAPPTGPSVEIQIGSITSTPTPCNMGVLGPPANIYGYILPPDDGYYTLIDPTNCGACHAGGRRLTMAHMELYFTEPCAIPVTISVVPAVVGPTGCLAPNPFAPTICPPVQYVVNDGGVLNTCIDFALPTAACCINGPAFLVIEFDQGTCVNGRPAFCGPAACNLCTQYNFYPGVPAPGDDLCQILAPFALTGNIMWVESTCCDPTSTEAGSWGQLKTLYR